MIRDDNRLDTDQQIMSERPNEQRLVLALSRNPNKDTKLDHSQDCDLGSRKEEALGLMNGNNGLDHLL